MGTFKYYLEPGIKGGGGGFYMKNVRLSEVGGSLGFCIRSVIEGKGLGFYIKSVRRGRGRILYENCKGGGGGGRGWDSL